MIKDDTILRDPSKEPSSSSKYDFQDGGSWFTPNYARDMNFGTKVKNNISWWFMVSRMTPSSKTPSQEPSTSSIYDFKDGGVLDSLQIMLKIWTLSQKSHKPTPKELE